MKHLTTNDRYWIERARETVSTPPPDEYLAQPRLAYARAARLEVHVRELLAIIDRRAS